MSDNVRLAKNSLVQYIRLFVTTILGLFTSRLVFQSLGSSDFGLYNVVGGIVLVLNVLNMAIASSSYRYIAYAMGKGDVAAVNKVFNISFVLHICLAVIIFLLAETVGLFYVYHYLNVEEGKLADAIFVFHFSVVTTIVNIISIPFQSLITSAEKFGVRSLIEIISAVLRLSIAFFLLYGLGDRLKVYSALNGIVWMLMALAFMFYCRWKYLEIVRWKFQKDASMYKEMTHFSGWVMLNAIAMVGWGQGTAIILNLFFGTIINTAYGFAKQVSGLITTFTHTLGTVAVPQIHKAYSSGNIDRTLQIIYYVSKYTFFLMLLASLPVLLETDYLLRLWLDDVPEHTVVFCQLTILAALIQSLRGSASTVVHSTGNIKQFEITISIVYLLTMPIGYLILKIGFPPYSVLLVYNIAEFVNLIVSAVVLKKLINFDIWKYTQAVYLKILYVVCLISPLFVIKNIIPGEFFKFIIMLLLSVVWLVAAIFLVGLENQERQIIRYRMSRIFLNFNLKRLFAGMIR